MDIGPLISDRSRAIDASGIRKVFELGAKLQNPINLSIGQPDFPVPDAVKQAAVDAIHADHNGYTLSQGIPALRARIAQEVNEDLGWPADFGSPTSPIGLMCTTGTSGGLFLALMALISPGDEIVLPDPYFVAYPSMVKVLGGKPVLCDTYPDFRMTAARIEPLITPRTKAVIIDSPGNPSGVVLTSKDCAEIADLCRSRGVLLISDEIYDRFVFSDASETVGGVKRCPSPCRRERAWESMLLVRGFGKTYGCTGWRLGYAAGPKRLLDEMTKLHQYTYVCAPAPLQHAALATYGVDMGPWVARYEKRRDMVVERLSKVTEVARPGGAFYAFPRVPQKLGMTAQQFCEAAIERSVLTIPGNVFSSRDSHLRLSFAVKEETLERGLDVLIDMMK
ncbi:MAG: aminotransferase class I/II-fold pyridoxal phosphate-dependent enzyme [Planctomycetaceae bacterium]|nr:aminotransferase class I/II-fold pyridoxal phosphate-dependent enzyme [Planctomycetaceae bacterium]